MSMAAIPAFLQSIFGIIGGAENSAQTAEDRRWIRGNFLEGMKNLDSARNNIIGTPATAGTTIGKGATLADIMNTFGGTTVGGQQLPVGPQAATGLYALADEFSKQYGDLKDSSIAGANKLVADQTAAYQNLANEEVNGKNGLREALGGVGGVQDRFNRFATDIDTAYGGRVNKLMDMLKGYGTQEKADIGTLYDNLVGKQKKQLAASGMGSTTAATSAMAGTERLKQADLARLNERLQKTGLDTYGAATKEQLDSRSKMGILGSEMSRLNALSVSDLSSRMNSQALDEATALGQWARGSNDIMTMNTLGAQQDAKLMPIQSDLDMVRFQEGARIGWQGAPDAVPLGTSIAAGIQPMSDYMAQQQALAAQRAASKDAARSNMFGSLIGAGSNIASAGIGAYGISQMPAPVYNYYPR